MIILIQFNVRLILKSKKWKMCLGLSIFLSNKKESNDLGKFNDYPDIAHTILNKTNQLE